MPGRVVAVWFNGREYSGRVVSQGKSRVTVLFGHLGGVQRRCPMPWRAEAPVSIPRGTSAFCFPQEAPTLQPAPKELV